MTEAPTVFWARIPNPPSTNNLFANGKKGRYPTKAYDQWRQEAGWELKLQKPPSFAGKVEISLAVPRNGRRDLDNHLKAPLDLLVSHGVIKDDSLIEKVAVTWHDLPGEKLSAILTVRAS